jgi:putative NADH-flavin reductase
MDIAILGASGTIGQRITHEALERGHEVKALVRQPASFPFSHPHLTPIYVDLFNPANLAEGIIDSDVVVNATGGRGNDIHTFYIESTKAFIEGVRRVRGKRFIVVGGAGSLEVTPGVQLADTPDFPPQLLPVAQAQRETLELYRACDLDWTFFSPSAIIAPGKRTGEYRLGTDQLLIYDQGKSYISIEDYAVALLDEVEAPQFIRRRFTAVSLKE